MSILNAITAGAGGVALTGDTSGNLTIQSAGTNVATFTSSGLLFTNGSAINSSPLNDYETGTWTPTLQFGGASVGITYSLRGGKYTKIGNMVFFTGYIVLSSKGSSTGDATFTSLPFSADTTNRSYEGNGQFDANGSSVPVAITILSYSTTVYNRYGNSTNFLGLQDTNFTNTSTYYFGGVYFATF